MANFPNIAGHENAKKLLSSALRNKKIAHSYLFIGVANLGKFLAAKEFAKSLSCQNGQPCNPCGKCSKCLAIERESDPDVLFINSPKSKTEAENQDEKKSISVEEIRILQHHLSLFPYNAKYKIAIVDEAHKFTNEATNAFLKTLEEPKGNAIIILTANESKFLLKTLISRTQIVRFWPLKSETIEKFLISRCDANAENAKRVSEISFGKPGLAIDFIKNKQKINERREKESVFWNFTEAPLPKKMIFVEDLFKKEENIENLLQFWLLCLRKRILEKTAPNDYDSKLKLKKMVNFMNNLIIILNLINSSNINKRVALEILALEV